MVSGDFFVGTVVGSVEMPISTLSLVANTASSTADKEANGECRIGTDRSICGRSVDPVTGISDDLVLSRRGRRRRTTSAIAQKTSGDLQVASRR